MLADPAADATWLRELDKPTALLSTPAPVVKPESIPLRGFWCRLNRLKDKEVSSLPAQGGLSEPF